MDIARGGVQGGAAEAAALGEVMADFRSGRGEFRHEHRFLRSILARVAKHGTMQQLQPLTTSLDFNDFYEEA